jgi:hypothetical protein
MKEIMLLSGLFTALAALLALVMAAIGVFALLTGRCTLCRDRVRGRAARIAGFFLTIPLILGIVTLPVFEPTLGIYDQRARVLMPLLAAISILVGAVLAFRQRANATIEA